jgi:predicted metal-dependent hydrolase
MEGIPKTEVYSLLLLSILIVVFLWYDRWRMVYIKAELDGRAYLVRNISDKKRAANLLAIIRQRLQTLVEKVGEGLGSYPPVRKAYVSRLLTYGQKTLFRENNKSSTFTSYTVNKGEEMVFCLRSKKSLEYLHDLNLLMYVAVHELAHVACPEIGHTPLFNAVFRFLLREAIKLKLYEKVDYSSSSKEYCGKVISTSIL